MQRLFGPVAMLCILFAGATTALDCGSQTVALIQNVEKDKEPPLLRSGSDFNNMLDRVGKKDWKGALVAHEAHLKGLGKWQAGSECIGDACILATKVGSTLIARSRGVDRLALARADVET
jgi:hypothetical protein